MAIKQVLDKALQSEMSRRQFLAQIGALFLTIIGFSAIMGALHRIGNGEHASPLQQIQGYGNSPYGK